VSARKKIVKQKNTHWIITLTALLVIIIGISFLYLISRNRARDFLQSKTQLNFKLNLPGIYKGDLPCADCPGIKETLTLTATDSAQTSGSYLIEDLYLERDPKPFQTRGFWEVVNTHILKMIPQTDSPQPQYFQVLTNGNLEMLDSNMQKIDSPFNQILTKQ
jgi:uncharacterized lipoprotein NlpE involved in copper resistance